MANNLRALSINAVSNILIKVSFSDALNPNIDVENITIISQTPGAPSPLALKTKVKGKILEITTQPLTSLAGYFIVFNATDDVPFTSLNATSILFEDGVGNKLFFLGPLDSTNIVKEYFFNYLNENIYNIEDGTVLGSYLNILSTILSTALYDVRQARNENYLSLTITDERKVRTATAFDHLNEEGAYEIIRVGKTETNAVVDMTLSIDEFVTDPISLLQANFSEILTINSTDVIGIFNINNFILNLSKRFAIKLKSVTFTYTSGHLPYVYNIDTYGYQILDQRYDSSVAFKYIQLEDNQIKLSDKVLEDPTFSLENIFQIQVSYQYKDTGRVLDATTITVESILSSGREVLPPLRNVFNLDHGPIVTSNNNVGSIGNIAFVDQNSLSILETPHPAFTAELQFRLDFLPSSPGEYSVDYATGTVYVFGANTVNDGTGPTPPLAIYLYRLDYKENLDWVVDASSNDLVALPFGNLINKAADVTFEFEQVLAKDIDYKAQIHEEILDERIGNNLVALNALTIENSPITNVFRIFNETSGEIYNTVRWNDNKIFFSYNTPPKIEEFLGERVNFESINNEVMFVNSIIATTNPSINIFKITLNNNNIMAQSEDCIGTSFNSTASLSDNTLFINELYFDSLTTENINLLRLDTVGKYFIDYVDGVLYIAVSSGQDFNIGTISYKRGYINLENPHITSVEDIYYRINSLSSKEKHFNYTNFDDGFILPTTFDIADEQLLSGSKDAPYIISSGQIGAFIDVTFINTVTDSIQFIRNIYENTDLLNNTTPINFAEAATFSNKSITVTPIVREEYHAVEFDGVNYVIVLNTGLTYLSPNITVEVSVTRLSDSQDLWGGGGSITLGNLLTLVLPGTGSPTVGDSVFVTYTYTINDLSHVIVDYNKGEYYVDYTALTDEIIVSYEYGNNALDFREASALNPGDVYFVSYKVGALRDALLKNFGSLIDISVLNTFDVTFSRERYRDAITGAMHSFSQGPTVNAIKDIVETISHLPAEVNESIFENWSLGQSLLTPREYETVGELSLVPVKYGNGILINQPDQDITLPVISNLKLEEGTFETWIRPEWDGLDNLADLIVTVTKDGYVASELDLFIGALEYHPTYKTNPTTGSTFFTLDKSQRVEGIPNKNKDGIYFYYNADVTGTFNRWFIDVIDGYANDGYIDGYVNKNYSITINTNGKFYDIKSTTNPQPSSTKITSGTNKLLFNVNSVNPNDGITFVSDIPHYILDFAEKADKNRFSIFKDESGYLNFKIFDKLKNSYTISANVSDWKQGELHHIATSWKLNNAMGKDELHLFIDGFEVPNIIRYGDRIKPYLHEKFRTINPEEIVDILLDGYNVGPLINRPIVSANDLSTVISSDQVVSSLDFDAYNILVGDRIHIEESGFDDNGYMITNVNGNTLTLDTLMPFTITSGSFVINKAMGKVITEIDIFDNFTVSLLHQYYAQGDLFTVSGDGYVSSAGSNFITLGVQLGDLITIDVLGFAQHYVVLKIWDAHHLTLNANMPFTINGCKFYLYHLADEEEIPGPKAIKPAYSLAKSTDGYFDNILTIIDKALMHDLVFVRTLGLNHRKVKRKYYVWSDQTNILKTKLPTPLALDEVKFNKVLLANTFIGPSNSTLTLGVFDSNNILTDQPSNNAGGRTLSLSIQGDNIDFTTPTTVDITGTIIDGYGFPAATIETVTFTERGVIDTVGLFSNVAYINVHCTPINSSKNCVVIEIKEKYSITKLENLDLFVTSPNTIPQPIVRYSYQVSIGNNLSSDGYSIGDGYKVTDGYRFFSSNVVGNYLIIHNPMSVAGYYKIGAVSDDHTSLELVTGGVGVLPLPAFTDGYYEILNTTDFRSGLQNGYFTFEYASLPGEPYYLTGGLYELDYYTYLQIPFDLQSVDMHIGADFQSNNQLYGSIDELQILNVKLTDTRVGETVASTQRTITKEFNLLKAAKADITSLVVTHFDTLPPTNEADVYRFADKNIMQAGEVINDNFNQSIALINSPIIKDNDGILDTRKEATIEFWVNPLFDTMNDPNYRFYLDAYGAVSEQLTSSNSTTLSLKGTASKIVQVISTNDNQHIDYFAGGSLSVDGVTVNLHKELPNQNMPVTVTYIPRGLVGDRISLYKDPSGYMNFNIKANNIDYQVRAPIFWARNTWHRVKATYKINSGTLLDEIHLFLDGYERGNVLFGTDLLFGQGVVYGSSFSGPNTLKHNIKFVDPINRFHIGSDYNLGNSAHCLIDNFRISNIARPLYKPFGEPLDPNYSSNLQMVYPITEDLYTTLLINFNTLAIRNDDFIILNSRSSGQADFSVNVLDSFGIINNNSRVKEVLEALIKSFKPANSRAFINYL